MKYKPVIIESPFKGNEKYSEEVHRAYLDRCIRDCIFRGETPYASHKMLTDALDDSIPEERRMGVEAGIDIAILLLRHTSATPVFYLDYSDEDVFSDGMDKARKKYAGFVIDERHIGKNPQ